MTVGRNATMRQRIVAMLMALPFVAGIAWVQVYSAYRLEASAAATPPKITQDGIVFERVTDLWLTSTVGVCASAVTLGVLVGVSMLGFRNRKHDLRLWQWLAIIVGSWVLLSGVMLLSNQSHAEDKVVLMPDVMGFRCGPRAMGPLPYERIARVVANDNAVGIVLHDGREIRIPTKKLRGNTMLFAKLSELVTNHKDKREQTDPQD